MAQVYGRFGRQVLVAALLLLVGFPLAMVSFVEALRAGDTLVLVVGVAVLLPTFCVAVRMPFLRIVAGPEDVRVVSYLRSRTVPWTEVARIEPPPVYGVLGAGIRFVLTDGSVVADDAFGRAPVESSRDTERAVRELEEFRRAAWVRHGLLDGGGSGEGAG